MIGVRVELTDFSERLTELDYDLTVEAIGRASALAETQRQEGMTFPVLIFEANQLVERSPITAEVVEAVDDVINSSYTKLRSIGVLAGENLLRVLQRKGVKVYDDKTRVILFATIFCAGKSHLFFWRENLNANMINKTISNRVSVCLLLLAFI